MLDRYKVFFEKLVLLNNKSKLKVNQPKTAYEGVKVFSPNLDLLINTFNNRKHCETFIGNYSYNYNLRDFWYHANDHYIGIIKSLFSTITDEEAKQLIAWENYYSLSFAIEHGNFKIMNFIIEKLSSKELLEVITKNNCSKIHTSIEHNHLSIVKFLMEKVGPVKAKEMILRSNTLLFTCNNIEIIKIIFEKIDIDSIKNIISANHYQAFYYAAKTGKTQIMKLYIEKMGPEKLQEMIAAFGYRAFLHAILPDNFDVIELLLELSNTPKKMVAVNGYISLTYAEKYGCLKITNLIIKYIDSEKLVELICRENYQLIRASSNVEVIELLIAKANLTLNELREIIAKDNYNMFINAAQNGHFEKVKFIIKTMGPEKLQEMMAANQYDAFAQGGYYGHLKILMLLYQNVAEDKLVEMLEKSGRYAFNWAMIHNDTAVVKFLLEISKQANYPIASNVVDDDIKLVIHYSNLKMFKVIITNYDIERLDKIANLWIKEMNASTLYNLPANSKLMQLMPEKSAPILLSIPDICLGYNMLNNNINDINKVIDCISPYRNISKRGLGILNDIFNIILGNLDPAIPAYTMQLVSNAVLFDQKNVVVFSDEFKMPEPIKYRFNIYEKVCNSIA